MKKEFLRNVVTAMTVGLLASAILCGTDDLVSAHYSPEAAAKLASAAPDFQKSYRLDPNGSVIVHNVSGNISVAGYDGDAVIVNGYKEGRDRDQVEIEDLSAGNRVEVRVRYQNCNVCRAEVRFEVKVPRALRLNFERISTASGDIEVSNLGGNEVNVSTASGDVLVKDVTGRINARTASGQMRVRGARGAVSAKSASGDVDVEINQLEGADDMNFSSASGNVDVRLPANLNADVEMSTTSGSVKTNFPIEVRESRYGAGSRATGRLGDGSRRLRISSASGNVSLRSL